MREALEKFAQENFKSTAEDFVSELVAEEIEETSKQLFELGSKWHGLTFQTPNKKPGQLENMQSTWLNLFQSMQLYKPQDRRRVLNSFANGLKLVEGRVNSTYEKFTISDGKSIPRSPTQRFMDGIDKKILFSAPSYVFTICFVELSCGAPYLESLQRYLWQESVKQNLLGAGISDSEVKLLEYILAIGDWIGVYSESLPE